MAPKLSEDEIDDLIYFARAGEVNDLTSTLVSLSSREAVSPAEILSAARDEGKSTCLHMATGNGSLGTYSHNTSWPMSPTESRPLTYYPEIVKLLVSHFSDRPKEEKQAFLDAPNEFGNTGLHWAALGGHLEVVEYLIAEGASPALANDKNYIPLDLASFSEKMNVVDYFLGQMEKMEGSNESEGLESAAAGMGLEGEEAGETDAAEDAEKAKSSSSS